MTSRARTLIRKSVLPKFNGDAKDTKEKELFSLQNLKQ